MCAEKKNYDQTWGILVVPRWTTQPSFTVVLNLLIDIPRVMKASAQNLIHPTLDSPHPLHQRLELLVSKLSGNPWKITDLARHCWSHHAVLAKQYTQVEQHVYQQVVAVLWWRVTWSTASLCEICSVLPGQSLLSYSALNTACSAVSDIDINVGVAQNHTPVWKHSLLAATLRVCLTRSNLRQNTLTFGLWTLS